MLHIHTSPKGAVLFFNLPVGGLLRSMPQMQHLLKGQKLMQPVLGSSVCPAHMVALGVTGTRASGDSMSLQSPVTSSASTTSPPSGHMPSPQLGSTIPQASNHPGLWSGLGQDLGDLCIHSINLNEIRHNIINDWLGKVITKYLPPRLLGLTLCRHLDSIDL